MFDFDFLSSCLNLLYHMQRCRLGPVIIQLGPKNMPTTAKYASIIYETLSCPDYFIAWS